MRTWSFLLSGLVVWAVHFFGLYLFASVWPGTATARGLALLLTALCLAVNAWLLRRALPALRRNPADDFDRWAASIATAGLGFSLVAVLWQGLPALLA